MNNIELTIIGDQAKRLREYAGVSIEEMISNIQGSTKSKYYEFEKGNHPSVESANVLFVTYIQIIEQLYWKSKKSFTEMLQKYCEANAINYNKFVESYHESLAAYLLNNPDKDMLLKQLKDYISSAHSMANTTEGLAIQHEKIIDNADNIMKIAKNFEKNNQEMRSDYKMVSNKYDILLEAIQWLENKSELKEAIREIYETDKECNFPNDTEQSYAELLDELKEMEDMFK